MSERAVGLTNDEKRRILTLVQAGLPVLDEIDAMVRARVPSMSQLVDLQAEHRGFTAFDDHYWACSCGYLFEPTDHPIDGANPGHRAHVAAAIRALEQPPPFAPPAAPATEAATTEKPTNPSLIQQHMAVGWYCDHDFSGRATCDVCFRNIDHAAAVAVRILARTVSPAPSGAEAALAVRTAQLDRMSAALERVRAVADDPAEMERALYRHSGLREDLLPLVAAPLAAVVRAALAPSAGPDEAGERDE